ncbi:MAG: hypothetical protein AAGE52_26165 [Myxococcota bacterium]
MPDPVRIQSPQPTLVSTPTAAPVAPTETQPSPDEVRDRAVQSSDVQLTRARPSGRGVRRAAQRLARSFRNLDSVSMATTQIAQDRSSMRALAGISERQMIGQLHAEGVSLDDAEELAHAIAERVETRVETRMRAVITSRLDRQIEKLTHLRDQLTFALEAPEGSPLAIAMDEFASARGTTRQELAAEVREGLNDQIEAWQSHREQMNTQSWEPGDFPSVAESAIRREFGALGEDSMARRTLEKHSTHNRIVHNPDILTTAEAVHTGAEIAHAIAHSGAAEVVAAGISAVGLLAGFAAHIYAEHNHDSFVEDVQRLVE